MVVERQFTVFKSLFGYAQEQKYYRALIEKGLQNYGIRLQSLAVKHLLKNIENQRLKRETLLQIDAYSSRVQKSKIFRRLSANAAK